MIWSMTTPSTSPLFLGLFAALLALMATVALSAKDTRLAVDQTAPNLPIQDAFGASIPLPATGGRVTLLTFFRNAGCPVCRLRFHELEQNADKLRQAGIASVAVFESDPARLKTYIENAIPYTKLVGDPELKLYNAYGVERSWGGVFTAMFHGVMGKASAGKKLFNGPQKTDGHMNRMEAEFLIDAQGRILYAHYGAYVGDHTPLERLLEIAASAKSGR